MADTTDPSKITADKLEAKKAKVYDVSADTVRALIAIIEAGNVNTAQVALILALRVELGDENNDCDHTLFDSTCDASNVFHCNNCGDVVPQPSNPVNSIR